MIDRFCEVTGANETTVIAVVATLFTLGVFVMIRPACWILAWIWGLI